MGQPQDVVASISDLQARFPGHKLCMVRDMVLPGLRWCVTDDTLYVQAALTDTSGHIAEAMTHLEGYRPTLVALDGGRRHEPLDIADTQPMRRTGSD